MYADCGVVPLTLLIISCLLIFLFLEQEMSELLQKGLPHLNYTIAESLLLLSEPPEPFFLDQSLCSHQHCLILLLYFAYTFGDRWAKNIKSKWICGHYISCIDGKSHIYCYCFHSNLLQCRFIPDAELFLAVRNFLLSAQDHGDCPPPHILRAALYLLAVCQDKGKALDMVKDFIPISWNLFVETKVSPHSHQPCCRRYFGIGGEQWMSEAVHCTVVQCIYTLES